MSLDLRTPAEWAPELRMDPNRIRQLIRRGELAAVKKYPLGQPVDGGKTRTRPTYLISAAAVDAYLKRNATEAA